MGPPLPPTKSQVSRKDERIKESETPIKLSPLAWLRTRGDHADVNLHDCGSVEITWDSNGTKRRRTRPELARRVSDSPRLTSTQPTPLGSVPPYDALPVTVASRLMAQMTDTVFSFSYTGWIMHHHRHGFIFSSSSSSSMLPWIWEKVVGAAGRTGPYGSGFLGPVCRRVQELRLLVLFLFPFLSTCSRW